MKFSAQEDIQAPAEQVFASISDFDIFETAARRRGAEVQRSTEELAPADGVAWRVRFTLQGKRRELDIWLTQRASPTNLSASLRSQGIQGTAAIDLIALSEERTRMVVSIDLQPATFSARLLMQSLKIAKPTIARRFQDKVSNLANEIETQHRDSA